MEFSLNLAKTKGARGTALVVCGMAREREIVEGNGLVVVAAGGDRRELERRLERLDALSFSAVVSFGIAGGLDPGLSIGDVLIPDAVTDLGRRAHRADEKILGRWRARLPEQGLSGEGRTLIGVDRPALTRAEKSQLRRKSAGAAAVDLESHVAAAYADRHKLPFAALRVISDAAGDDLPPLAARALRPDGSVNLPAVLGGLVRRPTQLPELLAAGRNAKAAFAALGRVRGLLGERLGLDL